MTKTIVLGGGCFWCFDASFSLVEGISSVEMGYSGGNVKDPTDEQIYYEDTGHAEVVKITYDPKVIGLEDILEIFFTIHDPTTLNRQGPDVGSEYRSVVFYEDESQKKLIQAAKIKAQAVWENPIVTEISKLGEFYPADSHHKNYREDRPDYCQIIINPKLAKLREKFAARLKP